MPYTTFSDVDNEIPNLSDLIPTDKTAGTEVGQTWVEWHIAEAEKEINGRLGGVYAVPFSTVPDLIASIALKLTAFRILRTNYAREEADCPELIKSYRDQVDEVITALLDGTITLTGDGVAAVTGIQSNTEDFTPTFTQTRRGPDGEIIGDIGSLEWA
jgi:phage gp36-like protein